MNRLEIRRKELKDTYKDLVISSRGRLLKIALDELRKYKKSDSSMIRNFMRGMLAGLKLATLELRWLHKEIERKEENGYTLVWLTQAERDLLDTWNP